MKVFQVITEEDDGPAKKEDGKSVTKILKINSFYAATDLNTLLLELTRVGALTDPEREVVSITEVISAIHILKED